MKKLLCLVLLSIFHAPCDAAQLNFGGQIHSAGNVSITMGGSSESAGNAEEKLASAELFTEMLKQKRLYAQQHVFDGFFALNETEREKIIRRLFLQDRHKYLYAKWVEDAKKMGPEIAGLIGTYFVMSSINAGQVAQGMALGPQLVNFAPKLMGLGYQFLDIYAPYIQTSYLSPIASFILAPQRQDMIVEKFLLMAPALSEDTRNFLIPRIASLKAQRDIKEEELQRWLEGFKWFTDVPQESFRPTFDNDRFKSLFATYSPSMRQNFEGLILNYIRDSNLPMGPRMMPRIVYYFQGESGSGKSYALDKISEMLDGAACVKLKYSDIQSNFLGKSDFPPSVQDVSPLLKALHTTSRMKKGRNVVVFIDEFDNMLKDRVLLDAFLELFTGKTTTIKLNGMDFDISHMYFVVAGNEDFNSIRDQIVALEEGKADQRIAPQAKDGSSSWYAPSQDELNFLRKKDALCQRLRTISFPNLSDENRQDIVSVQIAEYLQKEEALKMAGYVVLEREDIDQAIDKFKEIARKSRNAHVIVQECASLLSALKCEKEKKLEDEKNGVVCASAIPEEEKEEGTSFESRLDKRIVRIELKEKLQEGVSVQAASLTQSDLENELFDQEDSWFNWSEISKHMSAAFYGHVEDDLHLD